MDTPVELAKRNYPHMSDGGMQSLLVEFAEIYAGHMATLMLSFKTVGQVKTMLQHLANEGDAAEKRHDERYEQMTKLNRTPIEQAAAMAGKKKRRAR